MERSDIRDSSRVARAPWVLLRSTRATKCKRREGPTWRQRHAPQAREPNEFARAANFLLTRVTRIFQKSVLTKTAPAGEGGRSLPGRFLSVRGRRRAGVANATFRCRKRSPGEFHCFRIVINNGLRNSRVRRRPSWPGA